MARSSGGCAGGGLWAAHARRLRLRLRHAGAAGAPGPGTAARRRHREAVAAAGKGRRHPAARRHLRRCCTKASKKSCDTVITKPS
eukprot:2143264-Pyramimonas_sp.AAC.1